MPSVAHVLILVTISTHYGPGLCLIDPGGRGGIIVTRLNIILVHLEFVV